MYSKFIKSCIKVNEITDMYNDVIYNKTFRSNNVSSLTAQCSTTVDARHEKIRKK